VWLESWILILKRPARALNQFPSGTSRSVNTGVPDFDHHTRDTTAATRPTVTMEGNSQQHCKWSALWRTITRRSVLSLKCHVVSEYNSIYTLKKSADWTVDALKKLTNSQHISVDISCTEFFQTLMDKNFIAAFQWCGISCGDFYETHSCLNRL